MFWAEVLGRGAERMCQGCGGLTFAVAGRRLCWARTSCVCYVDVSWSHLLAAVPTRTRRVYPLKHVSSLTFTWMGAHALRGPLRNST